MSRKIPFAVAAFLLTVCAMAPGHSAVWQVSSTSGTPGEVVMVTIHFQGDGETAAADVSLGFSNTRLFVDAPVGDLPSGGGGL